MQEIQLQLELAEVNQILDALGEKPYKQVYQLIVKLQQQAEAQLQENSNPTVSGLPEQVQEPEQVQG